MHQPRSCQICNASAEKSSSFMKENYDPSKLNEFSYASRKTPEFMCHQLVRCTNCDLVYAQYPPKDGELAHAYHMAEYDSSEEANDAATAYIRAIRPTLNQLTQKQSALEIGTGTGIFLEFLSQNGFVDLVGVEPSSAAIAAAPSHRQAWIKQGMFDEKNFNPESFDLICCFMTMEHVKDPKHIANSSFHLLKQGGAFVIVTHDYRSLVNRLLGKRSPIIDIEHLQLFSKKSVRRLFEESHYNNISVKPFVNHYSLHYWLRLTPLPRAMKQSISHLLIKLGLSNIKLGMNVGNLITIGFKPENKNSILKLTD